MTTIFISDVHGCIRELEKMLHSLRGYPNAKIVFLGDLIGKGPQSDDVVTLVRESGSSCVMGNHEIYQLTANNPFRLSKPNRHFLRHMPTYIACARFLAVHAGIDPKLKPQPTNRSEGQRSEDELQALLAMLKQTSQDVLTSVRMLRGKPWHSSYHLNIPIVYGHWARQGVHITQNTIGIDSGCVYGGALSAYVLEEKRLIQVSARKRYC